MHNIHTMLRLIIERERNKKSPRITHQSSSSPSSTDNIDYRQYQYITKQFEHFNCTENNEIQRWAPVSCSSDIFVPSFMSSVFVFVYCPIPVQIFHIFSCLKFSINISQRSLQCSGRWLAVLIQNHCQSLIFITKSTLKTHHHQRSRKKLRFIDVREQTTNETRIRNHNHSVETDTILLHQSIMNWLVF